MIIQWNGVYDELWVSGGRFDDITSKELRFIFIFENMGVGLERNRTFYEAYVTFLIKFDK